MSFNIRSFDMKMLAKYYLADNENGIEKAIGKADCFLFSGGDKSSKVIKLWRKGDKENANKIMKDYVSRIVT